jgi:uncharacterized protein
VESPFPHHGPLDPGQVKGRDVLVADLVERITSRRVTAVLGPRRYGKTSVLGRVAAEVEAAGTSVVWVDLFELTSMVDLAIRFDGALDSARGKVAKAMARTAASIGFNLGLVRFDFAKPSRPDTTATVHTLLDVFVQAALDHPTLLVLDEFSGMARVDGVAGLLRTKFQHHFQEIGMLFAGSEPSTMRSLFSLREQPFYGQADLVEIGPLDFEAVEQIVDEGFRSTDRDPGRLAQYIHAFTGGHPRRVMQLADAAWTAAVPGEPWRDAVWEDALDAARTASAESNETLVASLSRSEQAVLRVLASGGSIWGRSAELAGLNPSPARGALEKLRVVGHVVTEDGTHRLVDPVLADWLKRTLPI